jgi:hypothetical protein
MARIVTIPTAGVSNATAAYTVGFARLEVQDRVEDAVGAGSRTLVSVGKVRGIRTAAHVLTHLPDSGVHVTALQPWKMTKEEVLLAVSEPANAGLVRRAALESKLRVESREERL